MNLKSNKGFTLVEILIAMCLMGILGTLVMNFMINGSSFYKKVYTDYDARNEARLAVHYISSRIRENDSMGAIKVEGNKIIITVKDDAEKTKEVDTIYYGVAEKKLYEEVDRTSVSSSTLAPTSKRKIADASSFVVELDVNAIIMKIGYTDSSNVEKIYEETLTLRSYN